MKASLIRAIGKHEVLDLPDDLTPKMIHGEQPFWSHALEDFQSKDIFTFAVVRNPFTRVLSAYLDKICHAGFFRSRFMLQKGLDPEASISFTEFLGLIDPTDVLLDQHWRAQNLNLMVGGVPLREVYHLERFGELAPRLSWAAELGVNFEVRNPHGTNALDKLNEHLTSDAVDHIRRIYRRDFELFGYSTDPMAAAEVPAGPLSFEAVDPSVIRVMSLNSLIAQRRRPEARDLFNAIDVPSFEEKATVVGMLV